MRSIARLALVPLAALLAAAPVAPLAAQGALAAGRVTPPPTSAELRRFDAFLDRHPVIDDELMRRPRAVDDRQWLAQHPSVSQYLSEHPGVRNELAANPGYFTWRAERREKADPESRAELARLDAFLDAHPAIDRDLERNPRLLDDPRYVASHPELHEFLKAHPGISGEALARPYRTMKKEKRYDRRER